MKLAEALILRADCKKRLEQLKARVIRNAKVQEGDQPAEEPQGLLAEVERVARELAELVKRINRTNSAPPSATASTSRTRWPSATHSACATASTATWRRPPRSRRIVTHAARSST